MSSTLAPALKRSGSAIRRPPTPPPNNRRPSLQVPTGSLQLGRESLSSRSRQSSARSSTPSARSARLASPQPSPARGSNADGADFEGDDGALGERLRVFVHVHAPTDQGPSIIDANEASSDVLVLDLPGAREASGPIQFDGVRVATAGDGGGAAASDARFWGEVADEVVDETLLGKGGASGALIVYGAPGPAVPASPFAGAAARELAARALARAAAAGGGAEVEVSVALVFLETVHDLLGAGAELALPDLARAAARASAATFAPAATAAQLDALLRGAAGARDTVTAGVARELRAMAHVVVTLRLAGGGGGLVHVLELAPPPPPRVSGVPGLAVEEYCSLGAGFKTFGRVLAAMASRKRGARPPFRESKLTRLLAGALGTEAGRAALLVCASPDRADQATTAAALEFAAVAARARARLGADGGEGKAMAARLQAELAGVVAPNAELHAELESQLTLPASALDALGACARDAAAAAERELGVALAAEAALAEAQGKAAAVREASALEERALADASRELDRQVAAIQSGDGAKRNEAMAALRAGAAAEFAALSEALGAARARAAAASAEAAAAEQSGAMMAAVLPSLAERLTALGESYASASLLKEALVLFMNAITLVESVAGPNDPRVVAPLCALAALYESQGHDDDAVALYNRAHAVDQAALGSDHVRCGRHLLALGQAYARQGKRDAAKLTLEEARSIFVAALGAEQEATKTATAAIRKLDVLEVDMGLQRTDGAATARGSAFVSRMEARLAAISAKKEARRDDLAAELAAGGDGSATARAGGGAGGALTARPGRRLNRGYGGAAGGARAADDSAELAAQKAAQAAAIASRRQLARAAAAADGGRGGSDDDDDDDDDDDGGAAAAADGGGAEDAALLAEAESRMAEVLAATISKAQRREGWAAVVDGAVEIERLVGGLGRARASAGAAAALRVLGNGLRSGSSDEARSLAALAVLMVLEWCVPALDAPFRRQLAAERWLRRLSDLARKDDSDKALVRGALLQLLANWADWYEDEPAAAGFGAARDALEADGFRLPPPQPRPGADDGADGGGGARGGGGGGGGGAPLGGRAGGGDVADGELEGELAVMREDCERLVQAVGQSQGGTALSAALLAEATQAAQDCRGWLKRLDAFLATPSGGAAAGGATVRATAGASAARVSAAMRPRLAALRASMAAALDRWEALAPLERKLASTRAALRSAAAAAGGGGGLAGGGGGATPRTRALFAGAGSTSRMLQRASSSLATRATHTPRLRGKPKGGGGKGAKARGGRRGDRSARRGPAEPEEDGAAVAESPRYRGLRGGDSTDDDDDDDGGDGPALPLRGIGGVGKRHSVVAFSQPLPGVAARRQSMARPKIALDLSSAQQLRAGDLTKTSDDDDDDDDDDDGDDGDDGESAGEDELVQELALLQMQADSWKAEWQNAAADNERLRDALTDARAALDARACGAGAGAGGGGDAAAAAAAAARKADEALAGVGGGSLPVSLPPAAEHTPERWRELCAQLSRAAGDERASLLDEIARLRAEFDAQRGALEAASAARDAAQTAAKAAAAAAAASQGLAEREQAARAQLERDAAKAARERAERAADAQADGAEEAREALEEARADAADTAAELVRVRSELDAKLTAACAQHKADADAAVRALDGARDELGGALAAAARWKAQWEVLNAEAASSSAAAPADAQHLAALGAEAAELGERVRELERAAEQAAAAAEAKAAALEEQVESLTFRLGETAAMARNAAAALKREAKAREDAEAAMAEAREACDDLEKELEAKEETQGKELAALRVAGGQAAAALAARAEAVAALEAQLAAAHEGASAAEARATEFARKYGHEFFLRKQLHNQLQEMVGNLRVYCRVRPPNAHELVVDGANGAAVGVPDETSLVVSDKDDARNPLRRYEYNMVYGAGSTQEEVFRDTEPLMTSVLDGFNVCIFAYGQSGSGKTYTMEGTADAPGLVLRAVSRLFEVVAERAEQGFETTLYLGMVEIYNETLKDLLAPKANDAAAAAAAAPPKKLEILKDSLLGMYVKDLTSVTVHTASHVRTLIAQGNESRRTMATGLNEQSSRSHMVVTLVSRTTNAQTGESWVGKLSLVDLAGSERLSKSETTGEAAKESMAINKSLTTLGTVIAALANGEKHVPFRDSKLTYLLQDSLGGNSKTLMMVNVSPSQYNVKETINSLLFANRAKSVALGKATKNREAAQAAVNKVSTTLGALQQQAGEPAAAASGGGGGAAKVAPAAAARAGGPAGSGASPARPGTTNGAGAKGGKPTGGGGTVVAAKR